MSSEEAILVLSDSEGESEQDVQVLHDRPMIQEVQSEDEDEEASAQQQGEDDVEVVQVVSQRPSQGPRGGATNGFGNPEDDVQIIRQQRATVRLAQTPIYLPGEIIYAHLNPEDDDFAQDNGGSDTIAARVANAFPRFRSYQLGLRNRIARTNHALNGLVGFQSPHGAAFRRLNSGSNDLSDEIWSQVHVLENQELDRKIQSQKSYAEPYIEKAEESIGNLPEGYQSNIDKAVEMVCPLCGVMLGKGIPEGFTTLVQEEKEKALQNEHYKPINYDDEQTYSDTIQDYGCWAPYQLLPFITEVDVELSRKVYYARCGHVFCGRCVQRIGSKPKKQQKSKKLPKNMHNPTVYAPNKCVAADCRKQLVGGRFVEIYNNN